MSIPKTLKNIKYLTRLLIGCLVLAFVGVGTGAIRLIVLVKSQSGGRNLVAIEESLLYRPVSMAEFERYEEHERALAAAALRLVGSRKGKVFYADSCGGAKRIKAENLIVFKNQADALGRGYRPATNCKVLEVFDVQ